MIGKTAALVSQTNENPREKTKGTGSIGYSSSSPDIPYQLNPNLPNTISDMGFCFVDTDDQPNGKTLQILPEFKWKS